MSKLAIARLLSSRGTDVYKCFEFSDKTTKKDMMTTVNIWSNGYMASHPAKE